MSCRVEVFAEHQTACLLESVSVSDTARAHGRHGFEVMMKARDKFARAVFNFKRLIEVFTQMPDRLGNAVRVSSRSREMAEPSTLPFRTRRSL